MNYLRKSAAGLVIALIMSVGVMFTTSTFGIGPYILIAIVLLWLAVGFTLELRHRGKTRTPQT